MKGGFQAFIFDLDGVLVDTAEWHYHAWRRLAQQLGGDLSRDQNEKLKGVSRLASLDIILETLAHDLDNGERDRLAVLKNSWYQDGISRLTPQDVLSGVREFLIQAKDAGVLMAVGSASKNARTILEKTELSSWFEAVVDGYSTQKAKPDPEVFLLAAEALGVPASACLVFEDAQAGIEAGLAAGMRVVGVGNETTLKKAHVTIPGFEGIDVRMVLNRVFN